jgi:hypothetical protein
LGQLTAHLLNKAFIETTRTVSKGVFRRLVDGEVVPITQLEFEGDETVQLNMKLHMSDYRGDINYTRFRDGVVALLKELLTALSKEGALKTFTANDADGFATNTRLLGASGPTQHGEDINVLMVAMTPSQNEPKIVVELMYMDPDQFVSASRGES